MLSLIIDIGNCFISEVVFFPVFPTLSVQNLFFPGRYLPINTPVKTGYRPKPSNPEMKFQLTFKSVIKMHFNFTLNTLRPRQYGWHFADIFKYIFFNENVWILIKISLTFVPKCPISNIPALVQIMASVQATSHYLNQWWQVYRRIYASLSLNELNEVLFSV